MTEQRPRRVIITATLLLPTDDPITADEVETEAREALEEKGFLVRYCDAEEVTYDRA